MPAAASVLLLLACVFGPAAAEPSAFSTEAVLPRCAATPVADGDSSLLHVDLAITGARGIDARALRSELDSRGLLRVRASDTTSPFRSRLAAYVQSYAVSLGWWMAQVDSVHVAAVPNGRCAVTVSLREGPRAVFGALHLLTATMDSSSTSTAPPGSGFTTKQDVWNEGAPFTRDAVDAALARLLASADADGYPLARAEIVSFDPRPDTASHDELPVDVTIRVDPGRRFTIDEFTVEGNARTSPDVIIRETRLAAGDRYDPAIVGDVRRRLERLGFFASVSEPELYERDGRGGLLLRVTEGNTNLFDGIIGYQPPRRDGEAGEITGLVQLSFRNMFGTGRRMDARWERATRDVSELALRYHEPWLFSLPLSLQGGFAQRQQDTSWVRRNLDARATWHAGAGLNIAASILATDLIPSATAGASALAASTTTAGGIEVSWDSRDNVYNPLSGGVLRSFWSSGVKRSARASGTTSDAVQRVELDASWYVGLMPRTILAVALHGRELRGASVDDADLYRLGGATTLRGYREEQFSGTRLVWGTVELRYSLGRRSFAFAFVDAGSIFRPSSTESATGEFRAERTGYGIGGRLETGLGVLAVSYALGAGDTFSAGKIHFGLINEF